MKGIVLLTGILLIFALPAYAGGLPKNPNKWLPPAEVVDSAGTAVGLWFPDVPDNAEYIVHTIDGITFTAGISVDGIRGGANDLYFESDCSGQPYIEVARTINYYPTRLTIPYQETFSFLSEQLGEGVSPLYYADSTSDYVIKTICAAENSEGLCNTSGGCESMYVYPALTWDWSGYVTPFLFK